jgi:uncharacterized repeat protein (TIGR01451 family)
MIKQLSIIGISAIALAALSTHPPVIAALQQAQAGLASKLQGQPKLKVDLSAERQVVKGDTTTWEPLKDGIPVQPGDTLRYQLNGANQGEQAVKNVVFTQPIPQRTIYILNSATTLAGSDVKITYSIDQGKQFNEKPMVQVKQPDGKVEMLPAPSEAYTHVRWKFSQPIAPNAPIRAAYQVKVR